MEFGVFIPIANGGWIMSGTSPKYLPASELSREICPGSCGPSPSRPAYRSSTATSQITVSL
jgi:hypothetical protein